MNKNHFNPPIITFPRQEGAVLIVSLILLVVMTMLGISAMEATKLETRMAANVQDYNKAFQKAEAGLAWTSAACIQAGVGTLSSLDGNFVTVPCGTPPESLKSNIVTQIRGGIQGKVNGNTNEVPYVVSSIGRSGDPKDPDTINVTLLGGIIMRTGALDMTVLKQVGKPKVCSLGSAGISACTTQSTDSANPTVPTNPNDPSPELLTNCANTIQSLIDPNIENCANQLVDQACDLNSALNCDALRNLVSPSS
jgi:Tfp pilus assembly protein PilX